MATSRPLIDTLLREIDDSKKLTVRQRTGFRAGVKKFAQADTELGRQGLEKIYVIIRGWWEFYDSSRPEDSPVQILPYSGETTNKGPEFDYENFPETLKRILCLFVTKHLAHMKSTDNRLPSAETES